MSPVFIVMIVALLAAQFVLPRRYAFVPLLIAVCHFEAVPVVQLGVTFTICKLVILAGLVRATYERRILFSWHHRLDRLVVAWMCWAIFSAFFHSAKDYNPLTIRLSLAYDAFGAYLYARSYLRDQSDFLRFVKCLGLVVLPLAALMLLEKSTLHNLYTTMAGDSVETEVRNGRVRAMGPFGHSILAGTFGAIAFVLLVPLRRSNLRLFASVAAACGIIVFTSASSGPIMTLVSGLVALVLWRFRARLPWIRRGVLLGIVALHLTMQAPIWFLLARIDLAGGSTGWHRAELISTALNYIGEWWLIGTEHTAHWMVYHVAWSTEQVDITNDYLQMGVWGGLPLMFLFLAVLWTTFRLLGQRIQELRQDGDPLEFVLWCVGSCLFAHCVTFISVSYFDQSRVALWMLIGAVPGLCASPVVSPREDEVMTVTGQRGDVATWASTEPVRGVNAEPALSRLEWQV
jgi:hypothetical protein